jgi:hypothetical protein
MPKQVVVVQTSVGWFWFLAGYHVNYWVPFLNFEKKKGCGTGIGPQKPVLNRLLVLHFLLK